RDIREKLLAPAPVLGALDPVTLADGCLGPAFEALEDYFGFRCGIPLPARHEFRPPSLREARLAASFSPGKYNQASLAVNGFPGIFGALSFGLSRQPSRRRAPGRAVPGPSRKR